MSQSAEFGSTRALLVAGTGVEERHLGIYAGIKAPKTVLPEKGYPEVETTYAQLRDEVLYEFDGVDEPIILIGHSQAGVHVAKLSLDPELRGRVSNAILLASPTLGFSRENAPLGARVLKRAFGNPKAAEGLMDDSDYIMGLTEAVENDWPETTKLTAMVPAGDRIVPTNIQLGITLPHGQEVHEIVRGRRGQVNRALARAAETGIATEKITKEYSRMPFGHALAGWNFRNLINQTIYDEQPEIRGQEVHEITRGGSAQVKRALVRAAALGIAPVRALA